MNGATTDPSTNTNSPPSTNRNMNNGNSHSFRFSRRNFKVCFRTNSIGAVYWQTRKGSRNLLLSTSHVTGFRGFKVTALYLKPRVSQPTKRIIFPTGLKTKEKSGPTAVSTVMYRTER